MEQKLETMTPAKDPFSINTILDALASSPLFIKTLATNYFFGYLESLAKADGQNFEFRNKFEKMFFDVFGNLDEVKKRLFNQILSRVYFSQENSKIDKKK